MQIGITGAAGGIGSVLADHLFEQGHTLCLIDNLSHGRVDNLEHQQNRTSLHAVDVSDFGQVPGALWECDVIFHLAAMSSLALCQMNPDGAARANVQGCASVLAVARATGARLVLASTSAVYEGSGTPPFKEDAPIETVLMYPTTKRMAELLMVADHLSHGTEVTILRFFNVFGPRQDLVRKSPPFVNYLIRETVLGRKPRVYAPQSQVRDYVAMSDVIGMLELTLVKPDFAGKVVNVASGVGISVGQIIEAVGEGLEMTVEIDQRSPEEFWDSFNELHTGRRPLDRRLVAREVLKPSIGDPSQAMSMGWSCQEPALEAIKRHASDIALRVRELHRAGAL